MEILDMLSIDIYNTVIETSPLETPTLVVGEESEFFRFLPQARF